MSIVRANETGLHDALADLETGLPICVPIPSPLPYAVSATSPQTVNQVKGRPLDQPVGMAIAELALIQDFVDVGGETLAYARWLSSSRLFSIMLPVQAQVPDWAAGSVSRGFIAVTLAWLPEVRSLLDAFGYLFLSSGNVTGGTAAVTAQEADAEFGSRLMVVDGDRYRDQSAPRGSASILRFGRSLEVDVVREGVQHARFHGSSGQLLSKTRADWSNGNR